MARVDPHSYFDPEQPIVEHLYWKVFVDFTNERIHGNARLGLHEGASGVMDLDSDGLNIIAVKSEAGFNVRYELSEADPVLGRRLRLFLPEGIGSLSIEYETSVDSIALQWLTPAQTEGGQHPFLFSQCQPHHARAMVPLQDSPALRLPYEAEVTVPEKLTAVMSAGSLDVRPGAVPGTRTFTFKMPQPIPSYLLALAVGHLESKDLSARSRLWSEPETIEKGAWEFAGIEEMIEKAEVIFGPYEWDRYDMLILPPAFPYGGMENPRLTFLTPTLLAGDRSLVHVVAHELAHSWTGNLITNATMNDFWLNEGFTVWAERRILEAIHGKDYAAMAWAIGGQGLKDAIKRFGADSPYTKLKTDLWGKDPDDVYSEIPYEKGARFVALLENTVGREAFDRFVGQYIERFKFTSITTEEFLAFLNEALPGLAGRVNAHAWIYETGLPANTPSFNSVRLQWILDLAAGWEDGKRPSQEARASWIPEELLIYLQNLPREIGAEDCEWLDRTFDLTGQGNYEILVEWLTIAASSNYAPTFDRIREVLTTVGRMKYIRPLYKALGGHPESRELGREIFAEARNGYHTLTRRVALTEIEAYPPDPAI